MRGSYTLVRPLHHEVTKITEITKALVNQLRVLRALRAFVMSKTIECLSTAR
jgi:hypothetical protein